MISKAKIQGRLFTVPFWRLGIVLLGLLLLGQAIRSPLAAAQGPNGIFAPAKNSTVRGQVQIVGTAVHPEFLRYELFFGPCPVSGAEWCGIGDAVFRQVQNGLLGVWDTTRIPDGTYQIQLRVVKQDGNYESYLVTGLTVANTQPPTATPSPTETPSTATATPKGTTAAGTPTVIIQQPPTSTPRPLTPTPRSGSGIGSTRDGRDSGGLLGGSFRLPTAEEVSAYLAKLGESFVQGVRYGVGAVLVLGAYLGLRSTIRFTYRRIKRRGMQGRSAGRRV